LKGRLAEGVIETFSDNEDESYDKNRFSFSPDRELTSKGKIVRSALLPYFVTNY